MAMPAKTPNTSVAVVSHTNDRKISPTSVLPFIAFADALSNVLTLAKGGMRRQVIRQKSDD